MPESRGFRCENCGFEMKGVKPEDIDWSEDGDALCPKCGEYGDYSDSDGKEGADSFSVECYRNGERRFTDKLTEFEARCFHQAESRLYKYLEGTNYCKDCEDDPGEKKTKDAVKILKKRFRVSEEWLEEARRELKDDETN